MYHLYKILYIWLLKYLDIRYTYRSLVLESMSDKSPLRRGGWRRVQKSYEHSPQTCARHFRYSCLTDCRTGAESPV